ncbi:T-cell antigen CD7-like isoform X1 [Sparus aurata]|uniref:T-cell antigen CD7-like isoform X1 n=1 Tax=Sparus aurata TaxID=8175 RepID=UPI0011C0ECA9|nr:T-cell antigen CD7-like isoform X1 [Sparus aurata]
MSAVWLKLVTVLCFCCIALGTETGGVLWKKPGEPVTIQCRTFSDQESLSLKKGLKEEHDVLFKEGNSAKDTIAKEFTGRLQSHGEFPNVSILIKNLTSGDTGPYWCIYTKFDPKSGQLIQMKGTGSVLLVVTDSSDSMKQCDPASNELVLVSVVISAAVLLGIIMGFFIWIIKTKSSRRTAKPRRVANNDVYEDMRGGTLRR